MGKKLITAANFKDFICNGKAVITENVIITPGAKDRLKEQGVEIVYSRSSCSLEEGSCTREQEVERKVVEMLVKEFNITDTEVIQKIMKRLKEMS